MLTDYYGRKKKFSSTIKPKVHLKLKEIITNIPNIKKPLSFLKYLKIRQSRVNI